MSLPNREGIRVWIDKILARALTGCEAVILLHRLLYTLDCLGLIGRFCCLVNLGMLDYLDS